MLKRVIEDRFNQFLNSLDGYCTHHIDGNFVQYMKYGNLVAQKYILPHGTHFQIIESEKESKFDQIIEEYQKTQSITDVDQAANAVSFFFARLKVIIYGYDD